MADENLIGLEGSISDNVQAIDRLTSLMSQLMDSINLLATNIATIGKSNVYPGAGPYGAGGLSAALPMIPEFNESPGLIPYNDEAAAESGPGYKPTEEQQVNDENQSGSGFFSNPIGTAAAYLGFKALTSDSDSASAEGLTSDSDVLSPAQLAAGQDAASPGPTQLAVAQGDSQPEKLPWWKTFTNVPLSQRFKAAAQSGWDNAVAGAEFGGALTGAATLASGGVLAETVPPAIASGFVSGGLYGLASGFITGAPDADAQVINKGLEYVGLGEGSSADEATPESPSTSAEPGMSLAAPEAQQTPAQLAATQAIPATSTSSSVTPAMIRPPTGQDSSRIATSPQLHAAEITAKSAQIKDNDRLQISQQQTPTVTNNTPTTINNTTVTAGNVYGRNYDPDLQKYYSARFDLT